MSWNYDRDIATFKGYGTACIFVRQARFSDGSVWKFNSSSVAKEMVKQKCGTKKETEIEKEIEKEASTTTKAL